MPTFTIGKISITPVTEFRMVRAPSELFTERPAADLDDLLARNIDWLTPHFAQDGKILSAVRTYLIRDGNRIILVDTGIGNDKDRSTGNFPQWHMLKTTFLDDLAAAGAAAERVDLVLATHLHVDHVGWNTRWEDGRWVPAFPNARYIWVEHEWAHWQRVAAETGNRLLLDDSLLPVADSGLVDPVPADHRITAGIRYEESHGHTPGHVCVAIESEGQRAVITGDLIHHALQFASPELGPRYDQGTEPPRIARRTFIERYADTDVLVFGTHFGGQSAGFIRRTGGAFRFEAVTAG